MRLLGKIVGWALGGLAILVTLAVAGLAIAARTVGQPDNLGVRDGRLAACPSSPNCVSTQAETSRHRMEPLPYDGNTAAARERMLAVLQAMPRMTLITSQDTYIHALFRSPTMGFPDDVEIYFDEAAGRIHFRSAARLGEGDMNKNRERMEQISAAFLSPQP